MPWTSLHLRWLVDTGERLRTTDGKIVEVWEFKPEKDNAVFSAWARHIRNHYCPDCEIDLLRADTGLSREQYLSQLIFPSISNPPGPSIRAGDFAEILVADFLEFFLHFWVPRFRYDEKAVRNESIKGVDILGFRFVGQQETPNDTLAIFEAKARLTGRSRKNKLQEALDDSAKDFNVRKALSLNALKRRLIRAGKRIDAQRVQRFQNSADHPYIEISGAAALLSTDAFDSHVLSSTDASSHPNSTALRLLVIRGRQLMPIVHELYRRAAHEA